MTEEKNIKLIVLFILIIILSGCSHSPTIMTNDEIISEITKCKQAELHAALIGSHSFKGFDGVTKIVCYPIED